MLTYLLGDVLRMLSGDSKKTMMGAFTPRMWLGVAAVMVIPIGMVVVSLTVPYYANRWTNVVAAIFFLFIVVGLPTYAPRPTTGSCCP